jgi:oligopeptide/dipeptide ABC transporter ATP-binding protein
MPELSVTRPLLELRGLSVHIRTDRGVARAVDDLDLCVGRGEAVGLVGESGCGKSMTALAIMRLVPHNAKIGGNVLLDGVDLTSLSDEEMRRVRGRRIGMIFQEPQTALNPVFTVGFQLVEAVRAHERIPLRECRQRAVAALREVNIPAPEARLDDYPHQLSGGMKQRAMIAMALLGNPALLIADEPTTALDVTVQAGILDLIARLRRERGLAVLLITHDLGLVAENADRVAIMYAGRLAEVAPTAALFEKALHPYTQGLFRSRPRKTETAKPSDGTADGRYEGQDNHGGHGERRGGPAQDVPSSAASAPCADDAVYSPPRPARLQVIPGRVPSALEQPPGCRFHPRCPAAQERCRAEVPLLRELGPGHGVACHFAEADSPDFWAWATGGGGRP